MDVFDELIGGCCDEGEGINFAMTMFRVEPCIAYTCKKEWVAIGPIDIPRLLHFS